MSHQSESSRTEEHVIEAHLAARRWLVLSPSTFLTVPM